MAITKLSEIAPELWIAEQPLRYLGFEAGRRMAVIRLADGGLLIHSPARLSTELRSALDQLGEVRFVVPASELHGHLYMEQYRDAYPQVKLFAAPGLDRKRKDLRFDGLLSGVPEPAWRDDLDQMAFEGWRRLKEIEFFHPKTRTLITGDLCCNFGPHWPLMTRLVAQGRVRQRLGPPTECRILGIFRDRRAVRRSLERILEWDFERVLPGHGEIVHTGGKDAFEEGFARLRDQAPPALPAKVDLSTQSVRMALYLGRRSATTICKYDHSAIHSRSRVGVSILGQRIASQLPLFYADRLPIKRPDCVVPSVTEA